MVYAHKNVTADTTSSDGAPIVDTSGNPNGTAATLYYDSMQGMTIDLHDTIYAAAAANGKFAGVIPAAMPSRAPSTRAWCRPAASTTPTASSCPSRPPASSTSGGRTGCTPARYGSYLDALVQFGTITGLDPLSLGAGEQAAFDLGIDSSTALMLETVASRQLGFAPAVPEPASWALFGAGLAWLGLRARRGRPA